jgi:hypothetical protein
VHVLRGVPRTEVGDRERYHLTIEREKLSAPHGKRSM